MLISWVMDHDQWIAVTYHDVRIQTNLPVLADDRLLRTSRESGVAAFGDCQ